jgi:lysophospholipase
MALESAPFHGAAADGPPGGAAWWLRASDGVRLRVGLWPADKARGTVLLFPGRTEYIEKYGRTAADLVAQGFSVVAIDWRGQGLADRLAADPRVGHVLDFSDYQKDLQAVIEALLELGADGPLFLLAHSMGGCIGLRALQDGLGARAAAFSAPMWGVRIAPAMRPVAWAVSWSANAVGKGEALAPGTKIESYVATEPFETNQLTRDPAMWDYMRDQLGAEPGFALGGPSLRWLNGALVECRKLAAMPAPDVPCLTLLGTAEKIVCTQRIHEIMAGWPKGRLEMVPDAEHEVLMEVPQTRHAATKAIADHFAAHI